MTTTEQREILEWFTGRAGDHIPNEHYQWLLVELGNLLSVIATGKEEFISVDDVCRFITRKVD